MLPLTHFFQQASGAESGVSPTQEKTDLKTMRAGFLCLAMCAAVAPNASAQMTWTDRAFVNLSVGVQGGSQSLTTASPFELYAEEGSVASAQEVGGGGFFDVSAGYKVWRNLAAGIGFSRTGSSSDAAIAASVPDPLVFGRLRPATGSASALSHSETVINLMGTWMVPVTDKIDVGISGGPSIFNVKQQLPTGVSVSEPGPTVSGVTAGDASATTVGINLGVDVTYMVTTWKDTGIGVGGLARYTWGSADLDGASDKLTVGGFQIGGGVRLRF